MKDFDKLQDKPLELIPALREFLKGISRDFVPKDLAHSLQYLRGTVESFKKDTDRCQERYRESFRSWGGDRGSPALYELLQFELRQLIRTFFAEVDGTIYAAR